MHAGTQPSDLELIALGVGDAFSARHYSTSLAVRHVPTGEWVLLDCPHPIRKVLLEACASARVDLPISRLSAILVSHLHADHCSGLEGLGYFIRYRLRDPHAEVPPEELPLLVAGPGVAETLAQHEHDRGLGKAIYRVQTLASGDELKVGPFRIQTHPTTHGNMACHAFRVADPAAGRMLSYSADTLLDPELITWLAEGDLVVHEIGSPVPRTKNHTSYSELRDYVAGHPNGAMLARKLLLAHYGDEFDVGTSQLRVLTQGWRYAV